QVPKFRPLNARAGQPAPVRAEGEGGFLRIPSGPGEYQPQLLAPQVPDGQLPVGGQRRQRAAVGRETYPGGWAGQTPQRLDTAARIDVPHAHASRSFAPHYQPPAVRREGKCRGKTHRAQTEQEAAAGRVPEVRRPAPSRGEQCPFRVKSKGVDVARRSL